LRAGAGIDQRVEARCDFSLPCVRKLLKQHVGDDEAEHTVAKALEAFVVGDRLDRAGMGQRGLTQAGIVEQVAGSGVQFTDQGCAGRPFQTHQRIIWNKRDGRISDGHFQISSGLAPPEIEKKMMLARPTRWSAGTKPTVKRLSVELSRLSPIMK